MSEDSFEEIVEPLKKESQYRAYSLAEMPIAFNTAISAGIMEQDCEHVHEIIILHLQVVGQKEPHNICVPMDSALGVALLTGDLTERLNLRLTEFREE